jgi:tRNA threonylcarbamoyladenosine biosynthesis protein TsaB
MFILAVDTTTFAGSASLLKNKRLLGEVNLDSSVTYSERLLPAVHFLLESNNLEIKDITGFALAAGPGSFTGIRIGVSTVKSFAFATGKPVAPVSGLKALALKMQHPQSRLLCPLNDAKKNELYSALFESKKGRLHEVIPQGAYSPDELFSLLPSNRIIYFLGSGVNLYREKIIEYFRDKARFSSRSFFISYEIGLLGYEILKKEKGLEAREVKPLYLRKSQAEENR